MILQKRGRKLIEGTVAFKGKQIKPYGGEHKADMEVEGTVDYTLPKKIILGTTSLKIHTF